MSQRSATYAARRRPPAPRASARRKATRRRRRRLRLLLGAAVVAIAAIVLLPLMQRAVTALTLPLEYSSIIRQQAAEKHLDSALVAAVIYAETKYDPRTSAAGAEGLMQIEPSTAEFLARRSGAQTFSVADLATPAVNIAYGCYYLRYLLEEYHGSKVLALAAYNGGETNVNRWLSASRTVGHAFSVSDIPFAETRAYVLKVENAQREYRQKYAAQLGYS